MRDHIIREIQRLVKETGKPPGSKLFSTETGIGEHQWRGKFWARWGDALTEAGFAPNAWTERVPKDVALQSFVQACRHFGHFPTWDEFRLYRTSVDQSAPSERAVRDGFDGQGGLILALRQRAGEDDSFADIAAMLPADVGHRPAEAPRARDVSDGFVYLIRSGEFFKIGRSDDLERRVKQIKVALPDKADLVHSIRTDDPPGIEAYWHRRFADKRANGEWFRLTSLDVTAFKKRKFQ